MAAAEEKQKEQQDWLQRPAYAALVEPYLMAPLDTYMMPHGSKQYQRAWRYLLVTGSIYESVMLLRGKASYALVLERAAWDEQVRGMKIEKQVIPLNAAERDAVQKLLSGAPAMHGEAQPVEPGDSRGIIAVDAVSEGRLTYGVYAAGAQMERFMKFRAGVSAFLVKRADGRE